MRLFLFLPYCRFELENCTLKKEIEDLKYSLAEILNKKNDLQKLVSDQFDLINTLEKKIEIKNELCASSVEQVRSLQMKLDRELVGIAEKDAQIQRLLNENNHAIVQQEAELETYASPNRTLKKKPPPFIPPSNLYVNR